MASQRVLKKSRGKVGELRVQNLADTLLLKFVQYAVIQRGRSIYERVMLCFILDANHIAWLFPLLAGPREIGSVDRIICVLVRAESLTTCVPQIPKEPCVDIIFRPTRCMS